MASQAFDEFHRDSPQPFMLRDVLPGPGWAPYRAAARPLPRDMEFAPDAYQEDGSCVKGMLVAVGLECIAALGIYGLWHFIR